MATPPTPEPGTSRPPVTISLSECDNVDAIWALLRAGLEDPWLDEIGALRTAEDDVEASLDIWSVALAAALKQPGRRETASTILTRLASLPEEDDED